MPTLEFKGKASVYAHHLSVPFRELVVVPEKSLPAPGSTPSLDDNLIIHGDNLEALKALLPRYAGKVDVIYIDPPYNTGNEGWAYNDNVNSPLMKGWLGKVVDREDLERHDKWLCMMWPRLELLRELLADDGLFCCSIDETEVHRLRMALDEILGEDNCLAILSRRTKAGGGSAAAHFAIENDFVLVYAKYKSAVPAIFREYDEEYLKRYSEEDEGGRYFWDTMERSSTKTRPYFIEAPDGSKLEGRWFRSEARFKSDLSKGEVRIIAKSGGGWSVQFKQRLPKGKKIRSLLSENEYKSSQDELNALGLENCFEYPKPTSLIELLVGMSHSEALVLDSFAGSGTTAQAVLQLNERDSGGRKFILIQLPEAVKNESCRARHGFDNIVDLTAERVRRVIGGGQQPSPDPLEGSFTYCELGEPIDLERFFQGKAAPPYGQVARYIVYTATGLSIDEAPEKPDDLWFVGEAGGYRIHLLYKPDLAWMKSGEAALTEELAQRIAKAAAGKPALVYGAQKFLGQKALRELGVTFCQMPYSIYRILGNGDDAA